MVSPLIQSKSRALFWAPPAVSLMAVNNSPPGALFAEAENPSELLTVAVKN